MECSVKAPILNAMMNLILSPHTWKIVMAKIYVINKL